VLSSKDDTVKLPEASAVPVARNQPFSVLSLLVLSMMTFHVPVRSAWLNAPRAPSASRTVRSTRALAARALRRNDEEVGRPVRQPRHSVRAGDP